MLFSIEKVSDIRHPLQVVQVLYASLDEFEDYAILHLDAKGNLIQWNAGAIRIYGFSPADMPGKSLADFYPPDEQASGKPAADLTLAAKGEKVTNEGWNSRQNGSLFYAKTVINVIKQEDATISGYGLVIRDMTAQKNLETDNAALTFHLEEKVNQRTKELAVVNHELEAFSYSVSHDLRTPLRAISGYSTMLKEDYEATLDNEAKRIINTIVDNTRLMSQLIDDLLAFSKLSRLEVVDESVSMKTLAEDCTAELLHLQTRKDYAVEILDMPACKGDRNMLRQVWFNLIDNALKYSSKHETPRLEAGATNVDNFTRYYVKDNGTGFDMKYSNKLFGVFQRLHRQDEFEGTGLGLALAKRIISKHGGEIGAEAKPGEGATFYFTIPNRIIHE